MEKNFKNILYMELDKLLADIEKMKNDPKEASEAFEATRRKVSMKTESFRMERLKEYIPKVAAALFLPLVAGLVAALSILGSENTSAWTEVSVPDGETQDILLSDGTSLTLNAGSRITYPECFDGRTREIFLDGELLADVAPDRKKPFIIHAGNQTLKVLGTRFTFKTYGDSKYSEVMLHLRINMPKVIPARDITADANALMSLRILQGNVPRSCSDVITLTFSPIRELRLTWLHSLRCSSPAIHIWE